MGSQGLGLRLGGFSVGGLRLGGFSVGGFRLGGFRLGGFSGSGFRLGGFSGSMVKRCRGLGPRMEKTGVGNQLMIITSQRRHRAMERA